MQPQPSLPGRGDHVPHVVLGLPAEFRGRQVGGGHDPGRVPGAAWGDGRGTVVAGDGVDVVDHLAHGDALAAADVDGELASGARLQGAGGGHVGLGQVGDVDVVADAGAVGGVVVVAEDAR